MAWLCVDEDGQEMIFDNKPHRDNSSLGGYWSNHEERDFCNVDLPAGTIKKLIGHDLTWKDEPALYDGFHDFENKPIEVENKKIKINWRILALSIIWSLLLVLLSDFAMNRTGIWKFIIVGVLVAITSFIFYFGYRDVDISSDYIEKENNIDE